LANFQSEREQLAQLEGLFQQKKFADGLAQAEAVLGQFPASIQLRFLKFKFLRELNRTGEALQLLREMHAMFGDNIMVLKELADLHFRQRQFPESLLYYKKLLFLDSFNSQAQERIKHLQGVLEVGVADKLADTKIEYRPDDAQSPKGTGSDAQSPKGTDGGVQPPKGTGIDAQPHAGGAGEAGVQAPAEHLALENEPPPEITLPAAGESVARSKAAAPNPAAGRETPFETESAAELYFKQGLYQEALDIYKNLFEKTGRTDFFLKIKAILMLLRTDRNNRIIEQLQRFLQLIQQRGSQGV
jgi:tetratricopeptide (TPR) repeat protein